jgi:hypothetical protein
LIGTQSAATTRFERPNHAPGPARRHSQTVDPSLTVGSDETQDAQPIAHIAMTARQKAQVTPTMMTRSTTTSVAGRATAMRRMRRRPAAASVNSKLFCGTNGCPSFLEFDSLTGIATCNICGFVRRVN